MTESKKGPIIVIGDHLATLKGCGGCYECPKDKSGKRLGPLVGYAGKYDDTHQWVGDIYYNLAKIEEFPRLLKEFTQDLAEKIKKSGTTFDCILGAPMGGIALAVALGLHFIDKRFVFAEKKVIAVAARSGREESELVIKRHEIQRGAKILLVEDVTNNFSTTDKVAELVKSFGAELAGLVCELNRSETTVWEGLPVISLMHIPTKQFRHGDADVAQDIRDGNVVWKPKNDWDRLMATMNANK